MTGSRKPEAESAKEYLNRLAERDAEDRRVEAAVRRILNPAA